MIAAERLTKRYGPTTAVDDLSFEVRPGKVTGFLGPNGAGKSTTLRMIVGLDAPDSGTVTLDGQAYDTLRRPLFEVGAMLEGKAVHPGRRAADHLLVLARSNGIPKSRVDEVLDVVGLTSVARKRNASVKFTDPREPRNTVGRSALTRGPSEEIKTSAASSSRNAAQIACNPGEPTSSPVSKSSVTLNPSLPPRTASALASAPRLIVCWPLLSAVPRPYQRSPSRVSDHGSRPARHDPAWPLTTSPWP